MYLIVGLGNPEEEYSKTRHNMGFNTINKISQQYNIEVKQNKFQALYGSGMIEKEKVILLKPQTYMNLSGNSVKEVVDFYKIEKEKILVIYDDMDIEPGKIKIRKKGSAGGHNGIKNIIANLGTDVFPRIKIGVGEKPKKYDLADYVLGHFSKEDRELMEEGYDRADHAVGMILNGEIEAAMNQYNRKVKPKEA